MENDVSHNARAVKFPIPEIFEKYLKTRGIEGEESLSRFLFPQLVDLPKPDKMKNLREACRLVVKYMESSDQIIIWGDYDVDGTTGTALLVNFLREYGVSVLWHIPNRLQEGYGLNVDFFIQNQKTHLSEKYLLLTVDCGISNRLEIAKIKEMGGEVIVTDHHNLPDNGLPDCLVLNPVQKSCGFHNEQLAGVGVAFYLAAGIRSELLNIEKFSQISRSINLKQYLAFVALGTLADVVDLTSTNRILVRAGLEALECTQFPGLQALLASCDMTVGHIVSEDIGFLLGPKINAAGRLGKSDLVVQLLTEMELREAKKLATQLTILNEERKLLSANNLETALCSVANSSIIHNKCLIVSGALHQGVAGIVASKLVEIYSVPVLVFAQKPLANGALVHIGSARSINGVNIIEMLSICSKWIDRFGGHEMAAGLTVSSQNFDGFSKCFIEVARIYWENRQIEIKNRFDIECPVEDLMSEEILGFIKLLEPFGPGNPQPIFQDKLAKIVDSRVIGKTSEHLHLTIRGKCANFKGIGFSLGGRINDVQKDSNRALLYVPTLNRFRGNVNWQVRVIDI